MIPAMKRFILLQLKTHHNMSLAAVRPDGYPQATTVAYAHDGLTLCFACDRASQKVRHLRRSSKVSLTINKDWVGWKRIQGLSTGARAKILKRPVDARRALALLARKFKDMKGLGSEDLAATVFVSVQPEVISVLDYRHGLGWTKLVRV